MGAVRMEINVCHKDTITANDYVVGAVFWLPLLAGIEVERILAWGDMPKVDMCKST